MTDEQIVKALECCIKSDHFGECFANKCPMISEEGCKVWNDDHKLLNMLYDLIKRQQAEIEKLNKVKVFNITVSDTKEIMPILFCHEKELKNQAIKEFAERLKSRIRKDIDEQGMFPLPYTKKAYDTVMIFINNLAKEMTEKEGADNA